MDPLNFEEKIIDLVKQRGRVKLKDLCTEFNIPMNYVADLCNKLEAYGFIQWYGEFVEAGNISSS